MSNSPGRSMSSTPITTTTTTQVNLHELSEITTKPHSFKQNPNRKQQSNRRYKPSRQLISDELKYLQSKQSNLKFDTPTYNSIMSPPSLKPTMKYCDITGLPTNYKCPSNQLRFYNSEIYQEVIKNMPAGVDQEYLQLRGANVILK
ncbi:ino80 complex subunit c [Candida albicans]